VRICIIGKFPPIQGGVSMRTYWTAHGLAAHGHEVHVVTNAKEAVAPYRMYMRPQDWERCEAQYGSGSVRVHWTDPVDASQTYIPMASPFVTKLAAVAARMHSKCQLDLIYSHYLEPYGVAGHLAAQIAGVPHVVRMAGSDAGRLWHHPQFETLYDHVLRSAEVVVAAGVVAERAIDRGVAPNRIAFGGGFTVPDDLFTPDGQKLDLASLRDEVESSPEFRELIWGKLPPDLPYFGVCGKLGKNKGSFALLAALDRLKRTGIEVGLVALAHGRQTVEQDFRTQAQDLDLTDRVLQIPFLPHWRVPEFLRSCIAVCCLEQNFPIGFHSPIIPREVLLCGACLVGSTEVIRKLPSHESLPHGYGCVAIEDVSDIAKLSQQLAAIVKDPQPTGAVGTRARDFARGLQRGMSFPQTLERILAAAVARNGVPPSVAWRSEGTTTSSLNDDRFPLTRLVAASLGQTSEDRNKAADARERTSDVAWARDVLAAAEQEATDGRTTRSPLSPPVRIEIAVAEAESEADNRSPAHLCDPLFRLDIRRWAMEDGNLAELVPVRDTQLRLVEFDYDVSGYLGARSIEEFPAVLASGPSYIIAFGCTTGRRREPLLVDARTACILMLSDGSRTAAEIARELDHQFNQPAVAGNLKRIENLFVSGLIGLRDKRIDSVVEGCTITKESAKSGT
jgi:glycosyltransferase involved in cell wall biosynthesis